MKANFCKIGSPECSKKLCSSNTCIPIPKLTECSHIAYEEWDTVIPDIEQNIIYTFIDDTIPAPSLSEVCTYKPYVPPVPPKPGEDHYLIGGDAFTTDELTVGGANAFTSLDYIIDGGRV